jgi:hypothetical protein
VTEPIKLQAGDIFLTRSYSFLAKAIRFFSRTIGESRTKVNHVGVVVAGGTKDDAMVVEALRRVRKGTLVGGYGNTKIEVAIYRPLNLTTEEKRQIIEKADTYVGRKYGYVKILTHWVDWVLQGAYVARRLTKLDRYPICSFLVARSFGAANKFFGVKPGEATPDDIWDFVTEEKEKYQEIVGLKRLVDW